MLKRLVIENYRSCVRYGRIAIAAVFQKGKYPRLPGDPESLTDPKKHLRDLVWKTYRKDYLNTVHNSKIARNLDLARLGGCPSFAPYPVFSATVRQTLPSRPR